MTARRIATTLTAVAAPLALTALGAGTASAHGSMEDPVSRVYGCFAEGPEAPKSEACKAAVAAGGPQAFYDWNGVNIADAGGRSKEIIPDGKLCSANREQHKGLDLPRADWPASRMDAGEHTFTYKGTAPHTGTFELYITKEGYDPAQPLKWSDLESEPFTKATDPRMENGSYIIPGSIPERSGRHLIYSIWQRSDSQEAFYSCSDVVFGKDTGGGGGQQPAAAPEVSAPASPEESEAAEEHAEHNAAAAKGGSSPAPTELAETGGSPQSSSAPYAIGAAGALAIGAAALFASLRRRVSGRHRS